MKFSRKLLPAIAMLLISAVMMSTASFAWFSTNTTAKANGISVQISAAKNLLISADEANAFKSIYDATIDKDQMDPASADKVANPEFYYVTTAGDIQPDKSAAAANTVFAKDTDGDNYATFSVDIKSVGEIEATKVANIVAKISLAKTYASDVLKSLRVLIVVDETDAFIYAPNGGTAGYKAIVGTTSEDVSENTISTFDNDTTKLIKAEGGLVAEQVYDVDVYVWFEGQDVACTAANAINLEDLGLIINFELVEENKA